MDVLTSYSGNLVGRRTVAQPGKGVDGGADARSGGLAQMIARAAEPLPEIDETEFGRAFDRFGDARVVLLGEASHGTSEFYRARAAITRWLIEQRGFTVVALE